ncbi:MULTISPECIES: hypothetical protein [unclassified Bradyrhizobium]|uniref:hypothetical protein n=1 Tax=unclassified Bradyrhizobium TaxID=2631580 RepID=UPI00339152F8
MQSRGTLLRAFYYTAIIEDQECSSIRSLIDWLEPLHRRHQGDPRIYRRPDAARSRATWIRACGRCHGARRAHRPNGAVLGRHDFRSLVEAVQRRGVRSP